MLGEPLVRALAEEGWQVRSLDIRPPYEAVDGVKYIVADVRDTAAVRTALAGQDVLVHSASALPSYSQAEIRQITVDATRGLFTEAERAGVGRVVHISSTAVYGLPTVVPTTEEYPRSPVDPYTQGKSDAEAIAEEFRAKGMVLPILRPKTFLGPNRMGIFAMLFEWAEEGHNFPVLGRGDVRIQMLAVEDLVDAVRNVMTGPEDAVNDAFNIAATEFGTFREDIQAVLDHAGHGKKVVSIPAKPAVAVLNALHKLHLSPVYTRLQQKLLEDSYVSVDKAIQVLGWKPRYSNQETILRTYDFWRTRKNAAAGKTSRDPWKQGALSLAKAVF